ncbi:scramblase (macronuclear) [Tetrahymena thermophila SB210]|uniref:Phospholipid scramblase n=1 Tax=Tetrahymena thermophila (strain SB210) TaxID=312017 RepID=Q22U00_TETTS|nr:scramblase [Tetrahymena thermophila SB210]EAR88887.1 scramblase [Tetrahymena thermophila SB210]|eukprot:XP_001009132.1 scramblase [Tetrahymena thermophila SB210]
MNYQYSRFNEESSNNGQFYQQQGQTSMQMQQFGNQPQSGNQQIIYQNHLLGQPINNYPQQGQFNNNYPNQGQQIPDYSLQGGNQMANYPLQGMQIANYPQEGQQVLLNYPNFDVNQRQSVGFLSIKTPLQKLQECQGIYIKQKLEKLQVLTGWQHENTYKVYQADINGVKFGNNPLFLCKEKSSLFQRMFLKGDMREFNMNVTCEDTIAPSGQIVSTPFLALERPFQCTFFNYNRPKLTINHLENGTEVLYGYIRNPFKCCQLGCEVYDENEQLIFLIQGECCQLGYICRSLPCNVCQEYEFTVQNAQGEIVSRLLKKSAGFIKAAISDCDDFSIGFPQNSTPKEKVLLMSAAIFLDYMYFENKQSSNDNNKNNQNNANLNFRSSIL